MPIESTPKTTHCVIQLTDAQRDTFAACGLIVIDGEPGYTEREPWPEVGEFPATVAPEGWRILTEPCDTCGGKGYVWTIDSRFGNHTTGCCPNPDCVGGRRVVTLTATCPECQGRGKTPWFDGKGDGPCLRCGDWAHHGTGVVTLGRFTIPALLPNDAGQFIARPEAVA